MGDPDGRILGYRPGHLSFEVVSLENDMSGVKAIGKVKEEIQPGWIVTSVSDNSVTDNEEEKGEPNSPEKVIKKQPILVSPFRNLTSESSNDGLTQSLSELLLAELVLPGLQPLERGEGLKEIAREFKRNTSALFDQRTTAQQGRFLSTSSWLISGSLTGRQGQGYNLLISLLNPETGELCRGLSIDGDKPWDFIDSMKPLAQAIQKIVSPQVELSQGISTEKITADITVRSPVPTGLLHLWPKIGQSLVTYRITNHGQIPTGVRVRTTIEGWAEPVEDILDSLLPTGETTMVHHTPVLFPRLVSTIRGEQQAQIKTVVETLQPGQGWQEVVTKSKPIHFLPLDVMCWKVPDAYGQGLDQPLDKTLVAAWVSPDIPALAEVISQSGARYPKVEFSGYRNTKLGSVSGLPENTASLEKQIEALVETLDHNYHLTYVNQLHTDVLPASVAQRILLPEETLRSKTANCLDGVVLVASLMRRLGLDPLLIIRPDHAYLGWWTMPRGQVKELANRSQTIPYELLGFLETTAISKGFAQAIKMGQEKADQDRIYDQLFNPALQGKKMEKQLVNQLLDEGSCEVIDPLAEHSPISILDVKTLKEKKRISQIPRALD